MEDVVYFELNNWFAGRDFPDSEPFISWMINDFKIAFNDEKWVKENKLCVVASFVDMSQNFCITSTKKWVETNCPELLTKYKGFIRFPEDEDCLEEVYGIWGTAFLKYEESNIGIKWVEED